MSLLLEGFYGEGLGAAPLPQSLQSVFLLLAGCS